MAESHGDSKLLAFLAYLLSILGFIIVLLLARKERFAMYHASQSLMLFISSVVVHVGSMFIPFLGGLIRWILGIVLFVLWIIGMINALTGKQKPLPIIGRWGERIKL